MKKLKIIITAVARMFALTASLAVFLSRFSYAAETSVVIETYDWDAVTPGIQLRAGNYLEVGMNFKIVVGDTGIAKGGQISVRIPSGWTMANTTGGMGYVVATTTAPGVSLFTTVASSGSIILVEVSTLGAAGLSVGDVVTVNYQQPTIQWNAQNGVVFFTEVRRAPNEMFMALPVQPWVDVVAGEPAFVAFETYGLTVKKDTPSSPITVTLKDNNWITTKSSFPVTISLSGKTPGYYDTTTYMYIYPYDPSAKFSATSNFSSYITQITIPAGQTSASFYYKTSTAPYSVIEISCTLQGVTNLQTMWVNVISGGITNASLSGGALSDGGKTSTIGSDENVFINFNTTESNISWQVYVSSSPDRTTALWTYWGYGIPVFNQISWNGRLSYWDSVTNQWRDEKAPNGTYYVRIQLGSAGGITDDTLKIIVQSYEISGRVVEYGTSNGIPNVSVNCWGPSYSYTMTDSSGYYRLGGLRAGSYYLDFTAPGYSREYKSGVSAGSSNVNVSLKKPGFIKINARRAMNSVIQNPEVWGGAQIYPVGSYYGSYWASLHFAVDVSTSDNGQWSSDAYTPRYELDNSTLPWQGGKWSVVEVVPGTYTIRADMWGYVSASSNVYLGSGEAKEVLIYFAAKKNAYGVVRLPEVVSDSWGAWVSLEATKTGEQWPSAWGYTYITTGLSSGTYVINGLDAGTYTIKTFAPGYRRASQTISVGVADEAVSVSDINLVSGGGLSGTITVEGNTLSDQSLSLWGDGSDNTPNFYLYLNAWSPDSYSYGWTQIKVYKNATVATATFTIRGLDDGTYWVNSWLNGFEMEGAVGWNGVRTVVKDGVGSLNITFRRYSGRLKLALKVPSDDYNNVKVSIQGPNLWLNDTSIPDLSMYGVTVDSNSTPGICYILSPFVGSGFYQIKASYLPTGYEKSRNIMAVNGQVRETSIDLTAQTYSVSGRVKLSQSNPPQGFSSLDVLLDSAAVNNSFWIDMYNSTTSLFVQAVDYSKMATLTTVSGGTSHIGYISRRDGGFSITGLAPGVYILKVPAVELDGNYGNGKETSPIEYKVYVMTSNVSGIDIALGKGYTIKGEIRLPSGEYATRSFYLNVYDARYYKVGSYSASGGGYVTGVNVDFMNSNSASYEIKGLAPGDYVIAVQDNGYWDNNASRWIPRQYANASISVKVEASDLNGQNINLSRGGKITLKLRDADSGTVITPQNKDRMLPTSFQITATANPWVDGGWATLDTISGAAQESNDSFILNYLPEAVYDITLGQSSYGMMMSLSTNSGSTAGSNQTNYALKNLAGINVKNNQTTDLGTIDIKQGLTITGIIKDRNGNPLPNIPVVALPSLSSPGDISSYMLNTITDINGKYSIVGLNPENQYYDIIACPRIDTSYLGAYYFWGSGGISYGEKIKSMVKISQVQNVDFVLDVARGVVSGRVVTEDGGVLQNPSDTNLPTARIFMQPEDSFPRTNPVGDIIADTDVDGSFTIEALAPGVYRLVVLSAGYASVAKTVTISSSSVSPVELGNIILERGAKISGKITKPDGKYPSTSEIKGIVALSEDMSEYLFGMLKKSGDKTVSGYELYGFRPGSYYSIMFISGEGDEMFVAKTSYSVPFSTYVKTNEDLILRAQPPALLVRARKTSPTQFAINFELTGALRKSIPADDDIASLVTVVSGAGSLSDGYLAPSRKTISIKYTALQTENKFTLRLKGYSRAINPETGSEFEIDESVEFYSGISAKNKVRVFNLKGGKITLEGDSSEVSFLPNTFDGATSTSTVEVQFMKGEDVSELTSSREGLSVQGKQRFAIPRAPSAYPSELYKAMKSLAGAPVAVSPLSSFYDVFLPRGISRALKKDARLTIQYSTSSVSSSDTPSSDYNIYYYDEKNNVWLLEDKDKTVDAENGTITVSISHTSVFTVIKSNAPVIRGAAGVNSLFVYNFPNPFNIISKEVTLADSATPNEKKTITGTMIHFGLPQGVSGNAEIRIYNVAGELVRTLKGASLGLDNLSADSHYYVEWDGKNDYGKEVASGIYIGRFTVNDKEEKFFKMAVIK